MMQSDEYSDQSMKVPGPNSEEMKNLQTVLGVLAIYWKPLRELVRLTLLNDLELAFFSSYLLGANIKKAIKLCKAIDDGQSKDADLLASLVYPWNMHRLAEKEALSD